MHSKPLKVGDHVLACNPDLPKGKVELIEGVITGRQLMKVAVDFGRRDSDVWTYDVTELVKAKHNSA